jgi:hypothetical protein
MKKLFTSALLAAVAVPFLMAAPAAKKGQDTGATTETKTKKAKKSKKGKTGATTTSSTTTETK